MYGTVRRARRGITVAAGLTGVVVAHAVAYVLAFSDPRQRAHVLSSTGHGYWSVAAWGAVLAAGVALAAAVVHGAIRASGTSEGRVVPRVSTLVGWQVAMFAGVEVLERLAAGAPVSELVHGHEFAIGLGLQVVIAAAVVVALQAVERLGARVAGGLSSTAPPARRHVERPAPSAARRSLAAVARPGSRAPPRTATLFA